MSEFVVPFFDRYIGIDYSGAETPTSSLKRVRVYMGDRAKSPTEVLSPPGPRKYWARRGVAEWLADRLSEGLPTVVGIDHGFSFPIRYFEKYQIVQNREAFLEDFQRYWPTDEDNTYAVPILTEVSRISFVLNSHRRRPKRPGSRVGSLESGNPG